MKSNAHLYLPWSVFAERAALSDGQSAMVLSGHPRVPLAAIEQLDGGCVLYRLAPRVDMSERRDQASVEHCQTRK
jgi:hypothetical protein